MENVKENQSNQTEGIQESEAKAMYAELPGMLFEKIGETNMFNADKFLEVAKSDKTVKQYLKEQDEIVSTYCKLLKIGKKHITMKLEGEPTMVHAALALSFASWVVPELSIYFFERIHELFLDGFSCSDRYLGQAAQRLPKQEQSPERENK